MLQISFLGLIISRQLREQQFRARRAGRMKLQSIALKQKQRETASIAEERFQLLKMLTHEVRQPLNTAQAALQSVIEEVGHGNAKPDQLRAVLDRALVTINSIALSISNSILGATLITKGRTAQFQMIDLCSISQMALLDINPADRARIERSFAQDVIFAEADPIVLRLAIRNLLENALKYSPAKSKVLFQIQVDEEEMETAFTIINEVADLSILEGDIFGLEKRGADSRYEGFGLGLYIVREVAMMHRGNLDYKVVDNKKVAFTLHLPC
jgi:signal transduction histidine kinase